MRSTETKGREAHNHETTSPPSTNCAPCGTPSNTSRNAISCDSCCSFHCAATKPLAWHGAKSTCSCGASESQRTAQKHAKPTNCHCQSQRRRYSRHALLRRKADWFFLAPTVSPIAASAPSSLASERASATPTRRKPSGLVSTTYGDPSSRSWPSEV